MIGMESIKTVCLNANKLVGKYVEINSTIAVLLDFVNHFLIIKSV